MSCAELDSDGVDPITDAELAELPIFPLPQCVLLPGGLLPLHVFEPRYRELTRYCLEGNRPMGVARLLPRAPQKGPQRLPRSSRPHEAGPRGAIQDGGREVHADARHGLRADASALSAPSSSPSSSSSRQALKAAMAELGIGDPMAVGGVAGLADRRPPVYQHVGVGRIICSEELEDGRYLILLRGVARVVIDHELPASRSFRLVQARRLGDGQADPDAVQHLHHQLMALCDRLAMVLDEGGRQLRELAYGSIPGACADAVAAALMMDADERQALLEQTCPHARLTAALSQVSKLLCQVVPCDDVVN